MSSWAEKRAQRMVVPWNEDTPDARGFWKYAYNHYHQCISLACEIADYHSGPDLSYEAVFQAVFDKVASPLVYLYESWCVMSPEKKAKFNPEIAEIHNRVKRQVEEAFKEGAGHE
jgi:hypothetical protein